MSANFVHVIWTEGSVALFIAQWPFLHEDVTFGQFVKDHVGIRSSLFLAYVYYEVAKLRGMS